MTSSPAKYGRDWVAIPKRRLYTLAAAALIGGALVAALLYTYVYGNPFAREATGSKPTAAFFVTAEGDVRVIRAGTRLVEHATRQTRLMPGDTVQTGGAGRARVALADGSLLLVTEDSVVTVAENAATAAGTPTAVGLAVARGLISMRTEQQPAGAAHTVTTPLTNSRLRAHTRTSIGVNEDRTEEIRVSEGRVETTTKGSGTTAVIAGGEYVAVSQEGAVTRREPLLEAPTPFAPPNHSTINLPSEAPAQLRWSRPESARADSYQLQIASSPFFVPGGIILERTDLRLPHLLLEQLRAGAHFWRVRAQTETGQFSEWSEPMKFTVTHETTVSLQRRASDKQQRQITRPKLLDARKVWAFRSASLSGDTLYVKALTSRRRKI
jgi:hypothetical protein